MAKLPKAIKIDNITYDIKTSPDLKSDGVDVLGCVSYSDGLIQLDENQSKDSMVITLVHEATHAILESRCIDIRIKSDNLLETIVDSVARGVVQLIKDNPELIKFIKS